VLASLEAQDILEPWELVIVDNCSKWAIKDSGPLLPNNISTRVVREERLGLSYARCAGIKQASAELICFVDDDNILTPSYLSTAVRVARSEPKLGVFGGKAIGEFSSEPGGLIRYYLPFYGVRDMGEAELTGKGEVWEEAEPIGAGMVCRSIIANVFRQFVEDSDGACGLGRAGNSLLSGEDTLFSRLAFKLNYLVGYRPSLSLLHVVSSSRMTFGYLFRLMVAHGRTHVVLERLSGRPPQGPNRWLVAELVMRFLHRTKAPGLMEGIGHFWWDIGYFEQIREVSMEAQYAKAARVLAQIFATKR